MSQSQDIVRVLRVIEYEGPRDKVERTVANSIQGERRFGVDSDIVVRAVTIGAYPSILANLPVDERFRVKRKDC